MLQITALRSKHTALVRNESPWIRDLSGPSGFNKIYRKGEHEVIVFSTCKPRACSQETLVGLIEPRPGHYGLVITRNGKETEFGSISSAGRAALACLDERAQASARAVEESIRNTVK